jgi:ATP-dependent helicase HrpB
LVTPLPIDSIMEDLLRAVANSTNVVLQAPPGAGKTTRVPLALLELPLFDTGRIIMLEPRRLAASHAAHRMAGSIGERVGETVGYAMRFDRCISERTRIEVVTEGVLTRRLQNDPCLEGVAMVIFDEFHERSLQADLALALCLEVQREVRADLRILVMSATLDGASVAALLGDAPVITSTGRSFPVEVRYLENCGHAQLPVRMSAAVRRALSETEGDILAFLPGSSEIRACRALLADEMSGSQVSVCALYGDLPFQEQEKAIQPSSRRKVVLATNIAETSLTIEGVRVVIDSGLSRVVRHDPANGMNRLVTVRASKASVEQRRGRAGRLAPGVCYRLFGRHTFDAMTAFSPPEITVSDLAPLVLELAAWGVREPASLAWLDPPPSAGIVAAKELLFDLGAIDRNGFPTETGQRMAEFPVHPRLARMLIRGIDLGLAEAASFLAALLTEQDIICRGPDETVPACESDLLERYEILTGGLKRPAGIVRETAVRAVERAASQLVRLTGKAGKTRRYNSSGSTRSSTNSNTSVTGAGRALEGEQAARLLLAAYPDRIARQREEGSDRYLLANGRGARTSRKSGVRNRSLILAVYVDAGEKGEGIIHQACALTEDLVRRECSDRISKEKRVFWDVSQERILVWEEEAVGAAVLVRRQRKVSDDEAAPVLLSAIRDLNMECLCWDGAPRQFLGRVRLIRHAFPEESWPDMGRERLLETLPEWLGPFLTGARSRRDIAAVDLLAALKASLSWEQQRLLDERAPTHIIVPSGSRIGIDYESDDGPVLAVKLQEMFGLGDTPTIAGKRVKLLLHLLSPARRPVQVTRDLRGFWENGYNEVKRELKGRYPKHPWPDDPWKAVATRMTNRMLKK